LNVNVVLISEIDSQEITVRIFSASLAVSVLLAGSTAMFAGPIPYPGGGQLSSNTPIIATGSSVVFFYGFSAGDTDMINIFDTTLGTQTGNIFQNQGAGSSSPGSSVSIATNNGDNLVVEIINTSTGRDYYSEIGGAPTTTAHGGLFFCAGTTLTAGCQPGSSSDGDQHAYVTSYGGGNIPGTSINPGVGTFVGMEDLDSTNGGDWDYNDDQFVLTGVTAGTTSIPSVPEPTSIALLGTGILGLAGAVRRKFSAR
jgi:hypothetical protein